MHWHKLCVSPCFALLLTVLSLLGMQSAHAQQTIVNVPSADMTPGGHDYVELESQFRLVAPGQYGTGTFYYARGLTNSLEADVTLYNLSSPPSHNVSVGIGLRAATPLIGKRDRCNMRLTYGAQALLSADGKGLGYWTYVHLSGKVSGLNTRLTAGISSGSHQLFGVDTTHFIGGIEQPLTSTISLVADWFSGNQSLGIFTSGADFALSKSTTLFFGYSIPNDAQLAGRQGFTFEVSHNF